MKISHCETLMFSNKTTSKTDIYGLDIDNEIELYLV